MPLSRENTCTTSCSHTHTWRSLRSMEQSVLRLRSIVCTREPVRTSCKKACSWLAHTSVGYTSQYTLVVESGNANSAQGLNCPRGAYCSYKSAALADATICVRLGGASSATSSSEKSLSRRQTSLSPSLSKTRNPLSYSMWEHGQTCDCK
jgi:hypothetical protein